MREVYLWNMLVSQRGYFPIRRLCCRKSAAMAAKDRRHGPGWVQAAARLIISQKPETLVIMSPHNYVFPDGATLVETPRLYGNLDAFGYPELAMDVRTDMDLAEEIFETATPKTDVYRLDAAWSDRFGHPLYVDGALSSLILPSPGRLHGPGRPHGAALRRL